MAVTDRPDAIPSLIEGNEEGILATFLEKVQHMRYDLPLWKRMPSPKGPLHLRCSRFYGETVLRANYWLGRKEPNNCHLFEWERDHTIDLRDEYGLVWRAVGKELTTPVGTIVLWHRPGPSAPLEDGRLRLVLRPEKIIEPLELENIERQIYVMSTKTEVDRWHDCRYDPPTVVRGEWVKPREETTKHSVVEWSAGREEERRIKLWLNPDLRIRFLLEHHLDVGTQEYGEAMRHYAQQKLCN